jgi:hypothetical protein
MDTAVLSQETARRIGLFAEARLVFLALTHHGWVAQLVEQGNHNPLVGGSSPSPAILFNINLKLKFNLNRRSWLMPLLPSFPLLRTCNALRQLHDKDPS